MTNDSSTSTANFASLEPPQVSPVRWGIALLVAASLGWGLVVHTPVRFQIPEELRSVDMYSPQAMQEEEAAEVKKAHWMNAVLKLTLAGLCFGAVPLLATDWRLGVRHRLLGGVGIALGLVFGILSTLAGLGLRQLMGPGQPLSNFGEGDAALMGDVVVFVVLSTLLVLPIAIVVMLRGGEDARQKAGGIPLAGILAGLVMPIATSFLFPAQQTNEFPPEGAGLVAVWFITLSGFVLVSVWMAGSKKKRPTNGSVAIN